MYLLLRSGEIKGTMIGPKQRRISYAELEAYVARKTGEPQSEAGAA